MADRKNKYIYQSGELDKTRKNLGDIDPNEAKRMAELLGGEVGLEKDSQAVQQGYKKISGYSRRSGDSSRRKGRSGLKSAKVPGEEPGTGKKDSGGAGSAAGGPSSGDRTAGSSGVEGRIGRGKKTGGHWKSGSSMVIQSRQRKESVKKSRGNYWVRIRTNFLAARREHNIKTLASALSSLLPFIPDRDDLNPRFLKDAGRTLYEPIEWIQKGAEELLTAGSRRNREYRPDPFYKAILEILAAWDIKTIAAELTILEKSGRGLQVESCARFCRALFTPIIKLQNLDQETHIPNSVRHFYELNLKIAKSDDTVKTGKLKKLSLDLMGLYPTVSKRIHYGCYPLLMQLSCASYSEYREFYTTCVSEYMGFLFLEKDDLLQPPADMPPVSPEENSKMQTAWEPPKKQEEPIPVEFSFGLRLLQDMFPQAGFEDLSDFPDFCPYFQPIFDLPRNFELLPPEDPLQGITVIISFLKELFFAFGGVEFTSLKNDEWDLPDVRSVFEKYTASWYGYLENFLPKQILTPLLEYCRGMEKSPDFRKSSYGEKLEAKIFWLKRTYCLPHMKVNKSVHGKAPATGKITRLYHLTEDLFSLFTAILNNDNPDPGIRNLDSPIHFEVPTWISQRFLEVLKRRGMEGTNSDLLAGAASILCLLNELLNKSNSFYYKKSPPSIFRSETGNKDNPEYSITVLDTKKIIQEWDNRIVKGTCSDEDTGEVRNCSREELEIQVAGILKETGGEGVILLQIKLNTQVSNNPMEPVLENTLRLGPDRWYRISDEEWFITLTETPPEGGVRLTTRLLNQLMPLYKPEVRIFTGLTPLRSEWTPDKALYISDNTLKESEKRRGEVVVLYNPEEKKYRLYTIKSRKKAEGKNDESLS